MNIIMNNIMNPFMRCMFIETTGSGKAKCAPLQSFLLGEASGIESESRPCLAYIPSVQPRVL